MNAKSWKALLLTALAVAGCGGTDSTDAEDAVETTNNTSSESALMDATAVDSDSAVCALDGTAVAALATQNIGSRMTPSGCVTATQNGDTDTYVFKGCTGPHGYVTVTGTVAVQYAVNSDCSVTAHGTGTNITANKATIANLDATAIYSKDSNGLAKAIVTTKTSGSGPRGITFDHNGSYTVTHDAQDCLTLDGTWSTDWGSSRGSAMTSTTASGLKKCDNACPDSGGSIVHDGLLGRVVTLTLDGSDTASWTSSNGKSGTVDLECGS